MTHEGAKKLICPFIQNEDGWGYCQTERCMMWVDWGDRNDGKKVGHCALACSDVMK
jgi:hypothetical protein